MAEGMGSSLLSEWRAYYRLKNEAQAQRAAEARAEAAQSKPRARR